MSQQQRSPALLGLLGLAAMVVIVSALRSKQRTMTRLNLAAMIKPPKGPSSSFFRAHSASQGMLGRASEDHWKLHWYTLTRGKTLGAASSQAADASHVALGLRQRAWLYIENQVAWNTGLLVLIIFSAVCDLLETEFKARSLDAGVEDQNLRSLEALRTIELVVMSLFTFEFLVRFICCPSRRALLLSAWTWLDIVAVLPYCARLGLDLTSAASAADAVPAPRLSLHCSCFQPVSTSPFAHSIPQITWPEDPHIVLSRRPLTSSSHVVLSRRPLTSSSHVVPLPLQG